MEKNKNSLQRFLIIFGIVAVALLYYVKTAGVTTPIVVIFTAIFGVVFIALWFAYYVEKIVRVVKLREEPWPQQHKFLWVLVGIGIVQVLFIIMPLAIIWGLNIPTVVVIVISVFLSTLAKRRLELVELEAQMKAKGEQVMDEDETPKE